MTNVLLALLPAQHRKGAFDLSALPCTASDPDLFFAESPADVEAAKSVCGDCPIRSGCLSAALERREPWGVWGGELVMSGTVVPRKRPRGRPRKEEKEQKEIAA